MARRSRSRETRLITRRIAAPPTTRAGPSETVTARRRFGSRRYVSRASVSLCSVRLPFSARRAHHPASRQTGGDRMSQTADRSGQREDEATPIGAAVSPRRLLAALREVALVATHAHTPSEVALVAASQVCRLLECDDAVVRWWNPKLDRLVLLADTRPDRSGRAGDIARGEGAVGIAFATATNVVVEDYARWEHQVSSSIAVGSGVAVPMLLQDS